MFYHSVGCVRIILVCRSRPRLGLTGALRSFSRYSESSLLSPRPTVDVAAAKLRGWNIWYTQVTLSKLQECLPGQKKLWIRDVYEPHRPINHLQDWLSGIIVTADL